MIESNAGRRSSDIPALHTLFTAPSTISVAVKLPAAAISPFSVSPVRKAVVKPTKASSAILPSVTLKA